MWFHLWKITAKNVWYVLLPSSFLGVDDHEDVGIGQAGKLHGRLHEDRREREFHALDLSGEFQQARRHLWSCSRATAQKGDESLSLTFELVPDKVGYLLCLPDN